MRLFPDSGSCPAPPLDSLSSVCHNRRGASAHWGSCSVSGLPWKPRQGTVLTSCASPVPAAPWAASSQEQVPRRVGIVPCGGHGQAGDAISPGAPGTPAEGAGRDTCPGGGGEEAQTQAVPDLSLLSVPSPTIPSAHLSVALNPNSDLGKVSVATVNCICAKGQKVTTTFGLRTN